MYEYPINNKSMKNRMRMNGIIGVLSIFLKRKSKQILSPGRASRCRTERGWTQQVMPLIQIGMIIHLNNHIKNQLSHLVQLLSNNWEKLRERNKKNIFKLSANPSRCLRQPLR